MPGRATLIALLVASASVLSACTLGPSDRPPVAVRDENLPQRPTSEPPAPSPTTPPPLSPHDASDLTWNDCTDRTRRQLPNATPQRVECASVNVQTDLDTNYSGNLQLTLDLSRVGSGTAPLIVLGETTGEPGTLRAARLAASASPELLQAYTLIGVDRRGTARSDPFDCFTRPTREEIIGFDPDVPHPDQLDELLQTTRTAIQTCVQQADFALSVFDAQHGADDLEQLRLLLDTPKLNILSLGEASATVLTYAAQHPDAIGRVAIDAPTDPTLDAVGAAEASAAAAEAGFAAFAEDCRARRCPLAPDPAAELRALADQLRGAPLRVGSSEVTAGTVYQAVLQVLGDPARWGQLSAALAAARAGDGRPIIDILQPLIAGRGSHPAQFDPALANTCNDYATRVPPVRAEQLVDQWRDRYPLFGPMFAQRLLLCSGWPVPLGNETANPVPPTPPILVIGTAGDPVTPASGARRAADQLPSGVSVGWEGNAHGAYGRSPCVTDLVNAFLVEGAVPQEGTVCPP